tara:strand:+ start:480 stop:755 length:276 start_codon:yes stop_codon:yes gene_type:complete
MNEDKKTEELLNETLNRFEGKLLGVFEKLTPEERWKLKDEYVELKYDFIKYLLRADRNFDFDEFQNMAKKESPLLNYNNVTEYNVDRMKIN